MSSNRVVNHRSSFSSRALSVLLDAEGGPTSSSSLHVLSRRVRCQTSADQISEQQLRHYFLTINNVHHYAPGSLRVGFNGIKFFDTHTCKRNWQTLWQVKIPNPKTLPEVLTIQQVRQIIDACKVERIAVYLWTIYSMGDCGSSSISSRTGPSRPEGRSLPP